ncbi:Mucin-associated surface protein (MASP) [Trypanosoma cruzi]|uniref:Mucin-associated surface protein (MASP), putative n=2 Tax=Trypanosoma cruzi TaxID=5693 RepID=Q4DLD6_TRYCC|nr:mucin-associated surface protein (MASP), putative [Trypanosoma cruzi]EAN93332.1 mucin-associated surface protein (MASP), putative [Trypanosoma cruzi]PWV15256.1 Mucin-associated surface protein (MASP) [Trypanosoma cruzi]|eukprot:XP_815183.1 mucin-associated surface protein (MASP) [Trypanosoma cruzi strain CL Brener]
MAMMNGRVLLVCALCVLWCVAGGAVASNLGNNAVGGCMASWVLNTNKSYTPSGCEKTALTLPLRSVLSITAVEASTDPLVTGTAENKSDLAPSSGADFGGAGSPPGRGGEGGGGRDDGAGGPGGVGGASGSQARGSKASVGGGGGSNGGSKARVDGSLKSPSPVLGDGGSSPGAPTGSAGSDGSKGFIFGSFSSGGRSQPDVGSPGGDASLSAPVAGGNSPPFITDESDALEKTGAAASTKGRKPQEAGEQSEANRARNELPELSAPAESTPEAQEDFPSKQEKPENEAAGRAATGNEKRRIDAEAQGPSTVMSTASTPPLPPPAPATVGEERPTAQTDSQNLTEERTKTPPSPNKKEPEETEPTSGDGVAEQQGQGTVLPDLKGGTTGSPAEVTASSISTSGSSDGRSRADENDDNSRGPNPGGLNNDPEASHTNVAPTASETKPPTAKAAATARTDGTASAGGSDGSTAVSHITSPLFLLLLVVACAAAAAVAA